MTKIKIKNNDALINTVKVISWLDSWKWNTQNNYNSINNQLFASRYVTDDYQSILQTLEILANQKYKRNIIVYIVDIIRRFQNKEDLLIRVACGLHLLTYYLNGKKTYPEGTIKILSNDEKFDDKLMDFKRTSTTGKKRLWCCIRDYKKET